jgi:membrane protein
LKIGLLRQIEAAYGQINKLSGGILDHPKLAIKSHFESGANEAAASIAFYVVFSLIPLVGLLLALGSAVVGQDVVQQQAQSLTAQVPSFFQDLAQENIQRAFALQRLVGLGGTIGLIWSATHVFTLLISYINKAWYKADPHGILTRRLAGLMMLLSLMGLLFLLLTSAALFNFLPRFSVPIAGQISFYQSYWWPILASTIPRLLALVFLLALYRWIPNTEVKWSAAWGGALLVLVGWEITTRAFGWYLTAGLNTRQLIYGPLGAIVLFMFWTYVNMAILLFGAHLSAAIAHRHV